MKERDVEQELKQLDELLKTIRTGLDQFSGKESTKKILESELTDYQEGVQDLKDNPNQPNRDGLVQEATKTLNQFKTEVELRAAVANMTKAGEKLGNDGSFTTNRLKSNIADTTAIVNKSLDLHGKNIGFLNDLKRDVNKVTREVETFTNPTKNVKQKSTARAEIEVDPKSKRQSIRELPSNAMKRLSATLSPTAVRDSLTNFTGRLPSVKIMMSAAAQVFKNLPIPSVVNITTAITSAANKTVTTTKDLASSSANLMKGMYNAAANFLNNLPIPSVSKIVSGLASAANKVSDNIKSFTSIFTGQSQSSKNNDQTTSDKSQKSTYADLIGKIISEEAKTQKDMPTTDPNKKVTISADKVNELFTLLQKNANEPAASQKSPTNTSSVAQKTGDPTVTANSSSAPRASWTTQGSAEKARVEKVKAATANPNTETSNVSFKK